jgi:integrase
MNELSVESDCQERVRMGEHVVIFRTSRSPVWYAQYNENGKQYKPSLKTRSQKQAKHLAKQIESKLTLGLTPERRRRAITIAEAIAKYLQSQQARIDGKSLTIYQRDLAQFVAFSDERKVYRLADATAEHLELFQDRLRRVGSPRTRKYPKKRKEGEKKIRTGPNSPKTIRSKAKTIRQMMKWALRRMFIDHDPAPGYALPQETRTKPQPFTPHELNQILENSEQPFKDVFSFFRLTGLRNDELCWLLKSDVDSQLRFVHVREKLCPFTQARWRPKHGNERIVPLCAEAQAIARRCLTANESPWLFVAEDTWGNRPGQFKKGRIWKALKAVLRTCAIPHGTVHTFRHCFCSFLANQNVSPFLVMKFMGHSSLDIVMTYYHAATDDLLAGITSVPFERMLKIHEMKSSELSANSTLKAERERHATS